MPTSWILSSLLVIAPAVFLSLGILYLIRKFIPHEQLRKNHEVAGFALSIIGVLYSVILGFTAINAQDRYNDVLKDMHTEAFAVADLYRDAGFFTPKDRDAIRKALRGYVDYVLQQEWWFPVERRLHPETQEILERIWNSYYDIEVSGEKMQIWYAESISKLNNLMNARLARLFSSSEHLGGMMWCILILGAVVTLCFLFFFGMESLSNQMILTSLVAGYISFMLYLVVSLDNAVQGPQGIEPTALTQILPLFERWDQP